MQALSLAVISVDEHPTLSLSALSVHSYLVFSSGLPPSSDFYFSPWIFIEGYG